MVRKEGNVRHRANEDLPSTFEEALYVWMLLGS